MPVWKLANLATQATLTEFGTPVTFLPVGGSPESVTQSGRPLRAVLDNTEVQILTEGQEPVSTTRSVLDLRNSDTSRPARKGDRFVVQGVTYFVVEIVATGLDTCQAILSR